MGGLRCLRRGGFSRDEKSCAGNCGSVRCNGFNCRAVDGVCTLHGDELRRLRRQFPSVDVERAQRFWSGVLGWRFGSGLAESFDYRMAPVGLDSAVAITPADEPGHPNVYMETSDLDAALARVRESVGEQEMSERFPHALPRRYRRQRSTAGSQPARTAKGTRFTCCSETRSE